jgi:hypothetical protein
VLHNKINNWLGDDLADLFCEYQIFIQLISFLIRSMSNMVFYNQSNKTR